MRDCNRCVYHSSGSCSQWECKGTKTVDDIKAETINELLIKIKAYCDECGASECRKCNVDSIVLIAKAIEN